ncbi:hypothetical protein FQN50_007761 [Emmonsiellopsis sp. PD_5]|nr:hypothetical protein FQN50_007761 [Emmonsiellopsis sp. PD_5]
MASPGLQTRITSLSSTHKQTIPLIHRLQNLPATPGTGDDARLELGSEIHLRLKEMEEQMELLRVELEQLESTRNRKRENDTKEAERERAIVMIGKLEEDLKSARTQFRKAQLQAKRNAEVARRKERQLLFAGVGEGENGGAGGGRRKGHPKFTHDDLVANASNDVTAALRRTHQLMQAELSRSQFAQETLNQSTAALTSLSESYSNLDTLLSSSRSLVSSLLHSQKSDTWYLETAFYILVGTIIWLVFRRIFYGPLWWILWLPLKLVFRITFGVLGGVGLVSSSSQTTSVVAAPSLHTSATHTLSATPSSSVLNTVMPSGTESVESQVTAPSDSEGSVLEKIEKIVEQEEENIEEVNIDDISPEERRRQEEMPRNPKKRMHEEPIAGERGRDEL